jgi:CRP-like cAMP-binding protein
MSVADQLRRVSLFADLHEDELAALADCLGRRTFVEHMILFHKSSPADSLCVIESGAVRIFAFSESGQELTLNVYGLGECFGETALLDGNLRTTDAVTLEKTVTYALNRGNFLRRLELRSQGGPPCHGVIGPQTGACHRVHRKPGLPGYGGPDGRCAPGARAAP